MTILENMALADNKGKPFNLLPGTNRQRINYYKGTASFSRTGSGR